MDVSLSFSLPSSLKINKTFLKTPKLHHHGPSACDQALRPKVGLALCQGRLLEGQPGQNWAPQKPHARGGSTPHPGSTETSPYRREVPWVLCREEALSELVLNRR